MAVRKIKGSWWVDFRFNGERYRKRSPDNTKAGAQSYEAYLRQKLAKGESLVEDDKKKREQAQTFKEFAWKWFETYVKNNNKYSEVKNKEYTLKTHLVPYFGTTPINKVTNLQVEQYKAKKIATGLSNKTVNNHLAVLGKCLRTAQEWLDLEKLPKIKKLKVPPQEFDYLTHEESQLLLSNAGGVWYEMILVALKTGLRLGELRALDWSDINWENRMLSIKRSLCGYRNIVEPTKNNKVRYVPLVDIVCRVLGERQEKRGFIFTDENKKPFRKERLTAWLRVACKKANLRRIGWHTLRHTFASHLAIAGVPLKHIQELLGHSDIKMTLRYAHLNKSTLRDAISVLEAPSITDNFWATYGQPYKSLNENQQMAHQAHCLLNSPTLNKKKSKSSS